MDEVKIMSGFTRGLVSKILQNVLSKKLGCKVNLQLNAFSATIVDGKVQIHADVDGEMDKNELTKLLKPTGLI